jgi:thiol-disulfide isomerase/thioredoxin
MRISRRLTAAGAAVLLPLLFSGAALAAPRAGDKAPSFTLKTADRGDARTLESFANGKGVEGVVVLFLSSRCPYVAQARAQIAELAQKYGGKVAFVGVNANQNERPDEIKSDAALNFSFPMLLDEGAKVADLYAATRTPEAFLVDRGGVVRYHGGVADLGPALADVTAGKPVAKAEAKAFGCTIKRNGHP